MVVISPEDLRDSYDFIIVGGGTSGLVLANRLSARPELNILVIEAGKHRPDDARINTPGLMTTLGDDPDYDWMFRTVPQKHLNGRIIGQPRGKVLGGSSALYYQLIVFPSKAGINAWESLGNPGWGWDGLAPYFRKMHTLTVPSDEVVKDLALDWINPDTVGTDGPLQVSWAGTDYYGSLQKAWPETFQNLKYKVTGDPFSGITQGAYCHPMSIDRKTARRSYAASAYYEPVADRPNLHVLTEVQVQKVEMEKNGESYRATGVTWSSQGKGYTAKASKEILVCAGAIQSPQILELSGIGDASLLSKLGIEPLIDNQNVGENMQDHAMVTLSFEVIDGMRTAEDLRVPGAIDLVQKQYQDSGTGPLSGTVACSAYMPLPEYINASGNESERQTLKDAIEKHTTGPDLFLSQKEQFKVLRAIVEDEKDTTVQYFGAHFQLTPEVGPGPSSMTSMPEEGNYMTIPANLSHPFSRGSIHIQSADVAVAPLIDPNYMSNPLDLELLARHLMFSEVIADTKPLADLMVPSGRRIPADTRHLTLDKAKEIVKRSMCSTFHPSSTCAMMPRDIGGVVNERCVVYGATNLRVVDASIFPLIPRGNISTSCYAVAEKAADLILEDLGLAV